MSDGDGASLRRFPSASEPGPYGIGSAQWPGVGKVLEEQNELGVVLGKLMGSGGARHHWSGDLVRMMQDEIADVRAALAFIEEANPVLNSGWPEYGFHLTDGSEYISRRTDWKLELFRSWSRGDPPEQWPRPEHYGLPPRPTPAPAPAGRPATDAQPLSPLSEPHHVD